MKRRILIHFANPNVNPSEHIEEIREAIHKANRNLYGRFDIWISDPEIINSSIVVDLNCQNEDVIKQPGRRLRGISQYLLKHYPIYSDYLNGTRLFNYVDVTERRTNETDRC